MQITTLHLQTPNLQAQHHFYTNTLNLSTTKIENNQFQATIGHTQLHFHAQLQATPYHFAINIPANKIQEAKTWLTQRVALQPYQDEVIINFEAWNAEAVYFYDADQNIVELIARKNTQPTTTAPFGIAQCLGISEIGTPTDDVPALCNWLLAQGEIPRYSGDLERFGAMGDEEGLFIVINKETRKWIPNEDVAFASPFEINFQQGTKRASWRFEEGRFTLLS